MKAPTSTAEPLAPVTVGELRDDAMLALSKLSTAAQAAGDTITMYGANRAWRELDLARRVTQSDDEVKHER